MRNSVRVQAPPFLGEVVLLCVRWYCKYDQLSGFGKMMQEHGVDVDPLRFFFGSSNPRPSNESVSSPLQTLAVTRLRDQGPSVRTQRKA